MAIKYYKLLDMLQRQGISKGQFAQMTGLSSATVAKLSGHRSVNVEIIDRVCSALNCQPGDIMEYVNEGAEASKILQHVNKFQTDTEYRRECRQNQEQEIAVLDSETQKSPDSN